MSVRAALLPGAAGYARAPAAAKVRSSRPRCDAAGRCARPRRRPHARLVGGVAPPARREPAAAERAAAPAHAEPLASPPPTTRTATRVVAFHAARELVARAEPRARRGVGARSTRLPHASRSTTHTRPSSPAVPRSLPRPCTSEWRAFARAGRTYGENGEPTIGSTLTPPSHGAVSVPSHGPLPSHTSSVATPAVVALYVSWYRPSPLRAPRDHAKTSSPPRTRASTST